VEGDKGAQTEARSVDMRRITRLMGLVAPIMLTATLAMPGIASTTTMGTDLSTRLAGRGNYPAASGYSEYHRNMMRNGRQIEVRVHNISRLAGKHVTVFIGGKKLGRLAVSNSGNAHRHWATWNGQQVPRCSRGTAVKIRTPGGALVASGTYRRHHHQ
jgi:hypothetical protein